MLVQSLGLEDPWRRKWQPTPVFVPGEFHRQRALVGYSPRGCKESDTTEQLADRKVSFRKAGTFVCMLQSIT